MNLFTNNAKSDVNILEFKGVSLTDLVKSKIHQVDIWSVKLYSDETLEYKLDSWYKTIMNRLALANRSKLVCWYCQCEYSVNVNPECSTLYAPFTIPVCLHDKQFTNMSTKGLFCGYLCAYNYNAVKSIASQALLTALLTTIEKHLSEKNNYTPRFVNSFYHTDYNVHISFNPYVTLQKYGGIINEETLHEYIKSKNLEYYESINN